MNVKKIKKDFPCLSLINEENKAPPIYFDNACMTLKPLQVINAMNEYYLKFPACGGHRDSDHWFAREVKIATENARESMRKFINARRPDEYHEDVVKPLCKAATCEQTVREIIWTKNTTEGINLIANSFPFNKEDMVIISDREHNSNLTPWQELKRKKGVGYDLIKSENPSNESYIESFKETMSKYRGRVNLVSMVHTSNLDGCTLPVKEIINIAHEDYGAKVLLDGAQSVPHKEVDVQKLNVDFLSFSVHKMLGPSGMGVLYGKIEELVKLDPYIVGGDTVERTYYYDPPDWKIVPELFEAGLQNYAGQIGAGAAAEYLMHNINRQDIPKHELKLNKFITDGLLQYKEVRILGPENPKDRAGIISFRIEDKDGKLLIDSYYLAERLDKSKNIMIRPGEHCCHSWFGANKKTQGSARVSLYVYNDKGEAEVFLEEFDKVMESELA